MKCLKPIFGEMANPFKKLGCHKKGNLIRFARNQYRLGTTGAIYRHIFDVSVTILGNHFGNRDSNIKCQSISSPHTTSGSPTLCLLSYS